MPERNEHWTKDEEAVDRYLRGELSREEHSRLQAHLDACAECRETIADEQRLSGSIREIGRRELRARLSAKLTGRKSQVPWPHVLSAAALLIVVIGVGLYSVWKDRQSITVTEHEVAVARPHEEAKKSTASADEAGKSAAKAARPRADEGASEELGGAGVRVPQQEADHLNEGVAPSPPSTGGQVLGPARQREFWLEGRILPTHPSAEGLSTKGIANAPRAMMQKEDDVREPALAKKAEVPEAPEIRIQQQPIKALPVTLQKQYGSNEATLIPTMVQSTPTGFTMTLYTDRFTLKDRSVRTLFPVPDSLIVEIDGSTIFYVVPPSLQSDFKAKGAAKH